MTLVIVVFELLIALCMIGVVCYMYDALCFVGRCIGGYLCPVRPNVWGVSGSLRGTIRLSTNNGTLTGCSLAEHRQRMWELENETKGESQ